MRGEALRSAPAGAGEPALEVRERIDRMPAVVPVRGPDLEVEVGPERVAGMADVADQLTGRDGVAGRHERGGVEVHIHVVEPVGTSDHDVVPGAAGLVGAPM